MPVDCIVRMTEIYKAIVLVGAKRLAPGFEDLGVVVEHFDCSGTAIAPDGEVSTLTTHFL